MASIIKFLRFVFFCVFFSLIIHDGMCVDCKVAKKKSKSRTSKSKNNKRKKNNGRKKQGVKKNKVKKKSLKITDKKEKQKKVKEKEKQKKVKEREKEKQSKEKEKQKKSREEEKQKRAKEREKEKQKKVKEREKQKKVKHKEKQKKIVHNDKKNNKRKICRGEKNKDDIEPSSEIKHDENKKSSIRNKKNINISEKGEDSNDPDVDINGDSSLRTTTNKCDSKDILKGQQKNLKIQYKENKKKFDDQKYKDVREKAKQPKTQQEIEALKIQRAERNMKKKEKKQESKDRKNIAKDQIIQGKNGLNNKVINNIKKENKQIKYNDIKNNRFERGDQKLNKNDVKTHTIVADENCKSLTDQEVKKIGEDNRKNQKGFEKDKINKNAKVKIFLSEKDCKNLSLQEDIKKEIKKNDKKTLKNDEKIEENNKNFDKDLELIAIHEQRINTPKINSNDEFICKDRYSAHNYNQKFFSRGECESLNQVRKKDPVDMELDLDNDGSIFNDIYHTNPTHNLINDEPLDNQNQIYSNKVINEVKDFSCNERSCFSDEFQEFDSTDGEEIDIDFEGSQVKLGETTDISIIEKDIMSEEEVFEKKKAVPFVEEPSFYDLKLRDADLEANKHSSEFQVNQSKILDFEKVTLLNCEKNQKNPCLTNPSNGFCSDQNNTNNLPNDTNYDCKHKDFSKSIVERYVFAEDEPQIESTIKRDGNMKGIICDGDNDFDISEDNYIEECKQNKEVTESFSDIRTDDEYGINSGMSGDNISNEIFENSDDIILGDSVLNFGVDNEEFDDDFANNLSVLNCFNGGSSRSSNNSNRTSSLVINKPCISIKEKLFNSFFSSFSFVLWTDQETSDEKFFHFGGEMIFNKLHIIECAIFFGVQLKDFYLYRGGMKFKAYKDKNPCLAIATFVTFEIGSIYLILEIDSNGKFSLAISPFSFCFMGLSYTI